MIAYAIVHSTTHIMQTQWFVDRDSNAAKNIKERPECFSRSGSSIKLLVGAEGTLSDLPSVVTVDGLITA